MACGRHNFFFLFLTGQKRRVTTLPFPPKAWRQRKEGATRPHTQPWMETRARPTDPKPRSPAPPHPHLSHIPTRCPCWRTREPGLGTRARAWPERSEGGTPPHTRPRLETRARPADPKLRSPAPATRTSHARHLPAEQARPSTRKRGPAAGAQREREKRTPHTQTPAPRSPPAADVAKRFPHLQGRGTRTNADRSNLQSVVEHQAHVLAEDTCQPHGARLV